MDAPTSPAPDLRPLAIGELVDRSAAVWRRHFGTFFRLYFFVQIGVFVLTKGFEMVLARFAPLALGGAKAMHAAQQDPTSVLGDYAVALSAAALLSLASVLLSWMAAVVGSHYAVRRQLGEPATLREGLARIRARFGTLLGAFVLSTLWGVAVGLVAMIPGGVLLGLAFARKLANDQTGTLIFAGLGLLVAGLGALGALLWYVLRFLLTAQVIAMEDVGAWGALKRSGELISGRLGRGFLEIVKVRATVLLTLVFAILLVVGIVSGLPAMFVEFAYANPFDPAHANPDAIPQLYLIPAELLQVLVQAVFSPLYPVFSALFYLDLRVRREGLDLELKLAAGQS